MDSKVALDKIKEGEQKAQRIIEEAQAQAREILREAGLAKEGMIKAAQEKAGVASQKLKIEIEQETRNAIAAIQGKAEEEVKILKEKARANLDKALQALKDKIG